MNFIVDAQLPRRLARQLVQEGQDAKHTLDLPNGNATPDSEIIAVADREGRVVVTKDADFVDSFLLMGRPKKLLLVSTGNIGTADLCRLVVAQLPLIITAFARHHFAELNASTFIIHA